MRAKGRRDGLSEALAWSLALLLAGTASNAADVVVLNEKSPDQKDKAGSLSFLDGETLSPLATVTVGRNPTAATFNREGTLIYVLSGGRRSSWSGQAAEAGALTVVDARERKVIQTIGVGFNPQRVYFTPDGTRAFCFSSGKKDVPSEVTVVDASELRLLKTISTGPNGLDAVLSPDSRWLFVLHGDPLDKDKGASSLVVIIDTQSLEIVKKEPVGRRAMQIAPAPDGRHVLVLCGGKPDSDKAKDEPGRVYVFDSESPALVRTLEVGANPGEMQVDEKARRVYVPYGAAAKAKAGFVAVLEGDNVARLLKVSDAPRYVALAQDEKTLVVACRKSVSAIDLEQGEERAHSELDFEPGQILTKADASRIYVLEEVGSKLAVLDARGGAPLAQLKTGRGGAKFGKLMGAIALTTLSYAAGAAGASATGSPFFVYDVYGVAPAHGSLATSEDGRYLYALNTQTNDISVLDTDKLDFLRKVGTPGGASEFRVAPGRKHVYVVGSGELAVFDTETNDVLHRQPVGRGAELTFDEAGGQVFVASDKGLLVLDAKSGQLKKALTNLPEPMSVLLREPVAPRREP